MPIAELASRLAGNRLHVIVFGPGYGESIAVHIPGGGWLICDSLSQPHGTGDFIPAVELLSSRRERAAALILTHPHGRSRWRVRPTDHPLQPRSGRPRRPVPPGGRLHGGRRRRTGRGDIQPRQGPGRDQCPLAAISRAPLGIDCGRRTPAPWTWSRHGPAPDRRVPAKGGAPDVSVGTVSG